MELLLEKYLFKKYPKLFSERKNHQSCMSRGIECGSGWFFLLNKLCCEIQSYIGFKHKIAMDSGGAFSSVPQVVFTQVKEKMGALRIYFTGGDMITRNMIEFSESLSVDICENCGRFDEKVGRTEKGWIQSLCSDCSTEYGREIKSHDDLVNLWNKVIHSRKNQKRSWKSIDELTKEDFKIKIPPKKLTKKK